MDGCGVAGAGRGPGGRAGGASWRLVPAGLLVGGFLLVMMRSYVELMRVVAEMLIPR